MAKLNHLEIYKHLEKTNCRQCHLPTCLAFAAAVLRGDKSLDECPRLENDVIEELRDQEGPQRPEEDDWEQALEELQSRVRGVDLSAAADRLGAAYCRDKLAVKCLGKDFYVDANGDLTSACHKNRWLMGPLLNYVLHSAGIDPVQDWVPFRELNQGATWGRLFAQRCEKPLKELVDNHTELFELMVDVFDGKPAGDGFSADISVVLHPLPKLPVLVCYWKKEPGFDSSLSLFFDSTANDNLNIESVYTLGVGLLTMFEKIVLTHETGA